MGANFVTGRTAKGAAVRGFVLGLVLQGLVFAIAGFSGPPTERELARLTEPASGAGASALSAQAHR